MHGNGEEPALAGLESVVPHSPTPLCLPNLLVSCLPQSLSSKPPVVVDGSAPPATHVASSRTDADERHGVRLVPWLALARLLGVGGNWW